MEMNLKAFMKEELKDRGTMKFPGIERFCDKDGKPIPFILKRLSRKDLNDIRDLYKTSTVYRDKKNGNRPLVLNGQVAFVKDYDSERAGLHIMVDAFVQPKLDDPELMAYYGVVDRLDMPQVLFPNNDEYKYANECVMEACGILEKEDEGEEIEKIKK